MAASHEIRIAEAVVEEIKRRIPNDIPAITDFHRGRRFCSHEFLSDIERLDLAAIIKGANDGKE
jgi:hypothetical protein